MMTIKMDSMKIFQLNNNQRTYGVKCEEVYPATISPIEYGYESTDTIALLSVEFAYRKWQEVDNLEAGTTIRRETYLGEVSEEVGIQNAKKPYMFDKSRIFK